MPLIDTHAHPADPAFAGDLAEVLERARAAGVKAVVAVTETPEEVQRVLTLAQRFPGMIRPAAGLFPTHLDPERARAVVEMVRANPETFYAVGEVGLDYWKVQNQEGRRVQRRILQEFIALARACDLPLNVHSRSAGAATLALLLEHGARRVQMHAFDGRPSRAAPGVEAGYFFSIPPSVVRSRQKQKLVRALPVESLLLESDSPVLGPDPGERNEPANIRRTLSFIAALKGLSAAELEAIIYANTLRLYGERLIPPGAGEGT